MYISPLKNGLLLFVVIIAVPLWAETPIYRNTWDVGATSNVNLNGDTTDPASFLSAGTGSVELVTFTSGMSNEPGAHASGNMLSYRVPADKKATAIDNIGEHFSAVTDAINALPPGTYFALKCKPILKINRGK